MTRAERLLTGLVATSTLFAPIFLGGVGSFERDFTGGAPGTLERFLWALGPWHILLGLAVATAAASMVVAGERQAVDEPPAWRRHAPVLLPFAGLVVLALVQSVPLPRALLGLLSPQADRELHLLVPGDSSWRPLSVSPAGTRDALAGLFVGGAALLGALQVARHHTARVVLLGAVLLAAAGSAAYGIATTHFGDDRVLIFPKREHVGVTGPFLNRSNLAGLLGLALPLALALSGALVVAVWRGGVRRIPPAIVVLGVTVLLAATLPLTNSRGAIGVGVVGLAALGLLAARASRWPLWARTAVVLAFIGAAGMGVREGIARVPDLERRFALGTAEEGFFDIRFPAWRSTLALAARYPVLGTGLGSYATAIHETQTPRNPDELHHAHSEPLELLAEGGLLGLALGLLLAAGVARACLRCAGADNRWLRATGCGAGAGLAALLAGSLFEFHFHIPALGIAAAVVTGVVTASAVPAAPSPRSGRGSRGVLGAAVVVVLIAVPALIGSSRAAAALGAARRAEQAGESEAWRVAALRAVDLDPGNAAARRSLSGALLAGAWEGPEAMARTELALAEAQAAVDADPFNAYSQWAMARALLPASRFDEAALRILATRRRAGGIGHLHHAAGRTLLLLAQERPQYEAAAFEALRTATECDPGYFTLAWTYVEQLGVPLRDAEAMVPDRVPALRAYANLLRREGEIRFAIRMLERARECGGPEARLDALIERWRAQVDATDDGGRGDRE